MIARSYKKRRRKLNGIPAPDAEAQDQGGEGQEDDGRGVDPKIHFSPVEKGVAQAVVAAAWPV